MDNSDDFGGVVDLRVVYSDGEIPFGYRKMRPASERFSNTNVSASLLKPAQEFSIGELQAIVKLARLMGLDFGEMDVLRDRHDGRIFVCDVNTTPFGPPNNIIREDWVRALDLYCSAFVQMIEHTSNEMASVASCLV
jgi:glutathione synthase/RimK-type ligase-like ATP-grasp enzyme